MTGSMTRSLARGGPALGAALTLICLASCSAAGSGSPNAGSPRSVSPTVAASSPSASSTSSAANQPVATNPKTLAEALPGIERFVEQERGLRFKRPVKAKVLGNKAFVAKLDKADGSTSAKDVESITATLSSLGLISPHADVAKAFKTADDAGTLGFYDNKTKRLFVRGDRPTPGVRAVLSHELTHALTDQWFGLSRPKLDKSNQELGLGFETLAEGDAERTRIAYEKQVLTPAQRQVAEHEENAGGTPHVPLIVLELIGLPYVIGPDFVDAVVAHGGIKALNAAYRHPPKSSEQLIDPTTYFAHDNPKHVARPAADGVVVDHGDLGYVILLLTLEHGLTRAQAQQGIIGWGGDQFVSWRAGDHRWCLRDSVVMDYGLATQNFDAALAAWVKTRDGHARIERSGKKTTFLACSS
jgi:hypothetical protein